MNILFLKNSNSTILRNVAAGVFDNPIDQGSLQSFVECPRHSMALAVDDGIVVGMASGVEYFHPDKPPQFWINEIGVTPEKRNQGIGRTLISTLIAHARARGCRYVWLGTEKKNIAANNCFSRVPDGEPPQDFVLYEWELEK